MNWKLFLILAAKDRAVTCDMRVNQIILHSKIDIFYLLKIWEILIEKTKRLMIIIIIIRDHDRQRILAVFHPEIKQKKKPLLFNSNSK